MNTRRVQIEARLQALEERATRKHQPTRPDIWSRYWARPVPSLAEIFGDTDPQLLPPDKVWARIKPRLPPVSDEFAEMTAERIHEVYRREIARQKVA